jgi:hypothetical protein
MDHYGLRGTVIATQDLVSSVVTLNARNNKTGQTYAGTGALHTESGKTYDRWSGQTVTPSSAYTVLDYDFGDVPLGDYDLLDGSGAVVASVTVQAYKDDYSVDPSGSIKYGHATIPKRIGSVDRFSRSEWSLSPAVVPENCATVSQNRLQFSGGGVCDGKSTMNRPFIIGSSAPVRIYFSAGVYCHAAADVIPHYAIYNRGVGYKIWLWDVDKNTGVHVFDSDAVTTYYPDAMSVDLTKTLDAATYSFTLSNPTPNHNYSLFLEYDVQGGCDPSQWADCHPKGFIVAIDPIAIGLQYY